MLSLSREKIYKGLRMRPIAYTFVIAKGHRLRPYALKRLMRLPDTVAAIYFRLIHISISILTFYG